MNSRKIPGFSLVFFLVFLIFSLHTVCFPDSLYAKEKKANDRTGKAVSANENSDNIKSESLDNKSALEAETESAKTGTNQQSNVTVVKIENARHTEYEKNEKTGNEVIVLTGNVIMSVTKGDSTTTISASTVRYDRKTNILFAQGDVHVKQNGSTSGNQDATADSLLFNTSTLEGIFDNSRIVQYGDADSAISSKSTLVASSKLMGKNASGTMAFKHAVITFCDDEDPHWKIRASKAWLLPGGEFAFLNAVLYVGHVPVLYLPAFYYPKDELIFNPVVGFDRRRGYFVQTTTYLLGRKPLSVYSPADENSDGTFSFAHPSTLKEQEREGIVLHNLDKDFKGSTDNYLKLEADYYTTLGGMVGLDGAYKPQNNKFIKNVNGFFEIGFTDTIVYRNDVFSRYVSDGSVYKDRANFLGFETPFRYAGNFEFATKEPVVFTLSMPIYTDPYFLVDFASRQEYMDWIGFLTNGTGNKVTEEQKNTDIDKRKITSYTWQATASYSAHLPESVNPYITTLSMNAASSVLFNSVARTDSKFLLRPSDWQKYTPEREKFYPSLVTPIKFSAQIDGTIYTFSAAPGSRETAVKKETDILGPKENPDSDSLPQDDKSDSETAVSKTAASDRNQDGLFSMSDMPELNPANLPTVVQFERFNYSLSYDITPHYVTQNVYTPSSFRDDGSFDWAKKYSTYYEVESPVALTNNFSYGGNFFAVKNSLIFDPYYQHHPNLDGYTSKSARDAVRKSDYEARKIDLTSENKVSFRPFIYDPIFKNTGLDWDTNVRIIRTKFAGDADNPEWDYLTLDTTDDCITKNIVTGYLSAQETENTSQTLTLASSLPPREGENNVNFNLRFPHVSMNFGTGVDRIENADDTVEYRQKPFQQSLSVNLFKSFTFTESFNYDMAEEHKDSFKLALEWCGFQAGYTMMYTYGYDYNRTTGWVSRNDESFQPYSLSLAYISPSKKFRYWFNRITWAPSLETSFVYNMIKPTDSYFTFIPAITFRINQFLDIKFSSESRNDVVYRYFDEHTKYGEIITGEKNVFVDLFNSFAFWDTTLEKRKKSGFKLKKLKLSVAHNLHDWTFASDFVFQPKLVTDKAGKYKYSYEPYFSFLITWKPMSGVRAQIIDEYGDFQLNP